MRRLLPLGLILILVVAAFAEEHPGRNATPAHSEGHGRGNSEGHGDGNKDKDDHDDNGPVQAGFAVITSITTGGTMAVFATFGLRKGNDVPQAGVLPSGLTTNALMFVSSSGRLSRNLGVAIVNPGSSSANVTLTLRDDKGEQLATTTTPITILARNQTSKFVTELFSNESVPKDLTGTLAITTSSTTTPVAVIGLRFRGSNFSTLPVTNLSPSTAAIPVFPNGAGGSGAVLLPEFVAGGGWATEIVVANTGTTPLTVRLDLFKQDGSALMTSLNGTTAASSFTSPSIPGSGVWTIAPHDNKGDTDF